MSEIVNEYEPWIALGKTETEYWTMRYMEQRQENASLRSRLEEAEVAKKRDEAIAKESMSEVKRHDFEGYFVTQEDYASLKYELDELRKKLDASYDENTLFRSQFAALQRERDELKALVIILEEERPLCAVDVGCPKCDRLRSLLRAARQQEERHAG